MKAEKSQTSTRPALPLLRSPKAIPPARCCSLASRPGSAGPPAPAEAVTASSAGTRESTCRSRRIRDVVVCRIPPGMREAGLATAEYAIVTLAAVGFAALLVAVLSSGEIRAMLMSLITNALSFG